MGKNLLNKTILIVVIVLVCIWGVIGVPTSGEAIRKNLSEKIHLGLDLRGGTHLVLQVAVNDAINAEADQTIERLKQVFRQRQITYGGLTRIDATDIHADGGIMVQGIPSEQTTPFRQAIDESEPTWTYSAKDGGACQLNLRPAAATEIRQRTLDQALETIRNRIDSLGVSEPTIQERGQGEFEILVQLPGVDDPARVKEIMQTTALLEIKHVKDGPFPSRDAAISASNGVLPVGTDLLMSVEKPEGDAAAPNEWYLAERVPAVTGRDLRNARPGRDENNRPEVDFTLNAS